MRSLVISNSITHRDQKSIEQYLNEVSKYDVLSPDLEADLFRRYRSGDEAAFEHIIKHNLRFVISVAKQYQHLGFWLGDLINEGNIGLIKAAKRFDETKGFKFISYAVWWIRQAILQAINEKAQKIRVPVSVKGKSLKVLNGSISFIQEHEREPSIQELAEHLEMDPAFVKRCLKSLQKVKSLDRPISEDDSKTFLELLPSEPEQRPDYQLAIIESQQKEVYALLNQLPSRQATVLRSYFGIGQERARTLDDIANYLGISRERVRQIRDKAIRRLRRRNRNFQPSLSN